MNQPALVALILKEISSVTGRRVQTISAQLGFADMGIESLQAVSIIANIQSELKLNLDATLMFDYPTVEKLAVYLERKLHPQPASPAPPLGLHKASADPIAVIGMSCRFPKAGDLQEFLEVLKTGKDCIQDLNLSRWQNESKKSIGWMGALENIDLFANDVFNISESEARRMDPQQRLLLEQVWLALEDAGYDPKRLAGSNTGVFLGMSHVDYTSRLQGAEFSDLFTATGNAHSIAANRLSFFFDFHGPSLSIDTACSSSLVALNLAVESLQARRANAALCAGANLIIYPEVTTAFAEAKMLSPNGRCFSFSDRADGYVRGEGIGVVYLKRLADAEKDGDQIYAVIRASSVNQDGRSSSLLAPSGLAQEKVIRDALSQARLRPGDIQYHEAHGTGTPLGDPIEALALERVHANRSVDQPLAIGTVKASIGHLESAAGIAGLIKSVLAVYHGKLFPLANFTQLNPKLVGKIPHLVINTELREWACAGGELRRASVSSFGFGGTNAHAIVEEYPRKNVVEDSQTETSSMLGFSSNNALTLPASAQKWLEYIKACDEASLHLLKPASLSAKMALNHHFFLVAEDKQQMLAGLTAFIGGGTQDNFWSLESPLKTLSTVALLFTGQGSQYSQMFEQIYKNEWLFKGRVDRGLILAQKYFSENLFEVWQKPDKEQDLLETDYGQILLFINEYALAELLTSQYGLRPHFVAGHSLGEVVAACFSGLMSFEDGLKMVAYRGKLMRQTPPGAMTSIFTSVERWRELAKKHSLHAEWAAHNGPELQMISGAVDDIEKLESLLGQEKIRFKRASVKQAFHSKLMSNAAESFSEILSPIRFGDGKIPVVSSVDTGIYNTRREPRYWAEQIKQPTQFYGVIQKLEEAGVNTFIEIGPQPVLNLMASRFVNPENKQFIHFVEKSETAKNTYFKGLSRLLSAGLLSPRSPKTLSLPASVFYQQPFWHSQNKGVPMNSQPLARENSSQRLNQRTAEIAAELGQLVASLMKTRVEDIALNENLMDLGADSLVLLNALQSLKDRYGVEIPMAEVFKDLNTLEKIAHYVAGQTTFQETNSPPPQSRPSPQETFLISQQNIAAVNSVQVPDLIQIIQSQIQLMNQQLSVLQVNPSSQAGMANTSAKTTVPTVKVGPTIGVLGNFKSRAETSKTKESAEKEQYLQNFIKDFNQQTPLTKAHVQRYRKPLADNRVSAGFRPNTKEMVYPIHCVSAKGSRFVDMEGKEYIDFTMGFGVNLFGHSPDFIETKVLEQIRLGQCVGPQSFLAGPVAELMTELTGLERVAFVNSGTEAVMTAIRLARAFSKKSKIVIFNGSYHGHFDGVLARPAEGLRSVPVAAGIPVSMTEDIVVLDYGVPESLEVIRKLGPELAAVLVEPVQSRFPENQPQEFLLKLREITTQTDTAFIWDEVITGFRVNIGGSQKHFGVQADLATYGKILGGGLPIGAVAGHHRYLDFIDGGDWQFGDDSYPQNEMTFFAGTFCKHPLAMAAAHAVLLKLKKEGPEIITALNLKTEKLKDNLNRYFAEVGLDIQVNNFGSLFRFKASLNLDLFFAELNLRGFYIWEGRNLFLSTAHTQAEIDSFEKAVKEVIKKLLAVKFFPVQNSVSEKDPQKKKFKLTEHQLRFAEGDRQNSALICVSAKVKGPLRTELLQKSIEFIVQHYDLFRCRVNLSERTQSFVTQSGKIDFSFTSLRDSPRPWKELDKDLKKLSTQGLDIQETNSLRVHLYDVVEETHVMAVNCHHLLFDGWSMTLFFEDLAQVYNQLLKGQSPQLAERLKFQDYLQMQESKPPAAGEKYWHLEFANPPPPVFGAASDRGERIVFDLEPDLYKGLKKRAQSEKMTPFMFLFSVYAWVLLKKKSLTEIVIGIPAAQREISGSDKMYGNCSNLLAVRLSQETQTIGDFLPRAKNKIVQAYQHMNYPYEVLRRETGPLIQIYFNLEPTSDLPELDEVSLIIYPYPIAYSEMPLMLNITDFEHYYHCEFDFQTEAITDDEVLDIIERMKKEIRKILV